MRSRRLPVATVLLVAATLAGLVAASVLDLGPLGTRGGADGTWTAAASEAWPADAVVYHVFVDRFADGDALDTQVGGPPLDADPAPGEAGTATRPWALGPDDPGYATALTDWMGGDLAGLRDRLDHVVALGANTIWLSPVTPGPYFHGYHPTDLTDVDPRFGDVEGLRALVADAHERGLKVVYDLVLNHTSDQHPWFIAAQADCAGSPYVAYYRFRECPDRYAAFANLPELPQLDLGHPPLRSHVLDEVLPFWLDDVGVDGFRLDHAEGPSRDLWRALRTEVDDRWPGTLLLGEVWASQAIIDSYADVLDAATAFPLRDRFLAVFAGGGDVRAAAMPVATLQEAVAAGSAPRPATYLSSHDQSRFAWEADGDTRRTALAYAALLTLPGLPVVYYGDEVGLSQSDALPPGADFADRWFREPMPWDRGAWDEALLASVTSLARLRTNAPALFDDAAYREVLGEGEVWAHERVAADGTQRLLVLLNTAEEAVTVALDDLDVDLAPDGTGGGLAVLHGDRAAVRPADTSGPVVDLDPLAAVVLELPVG
jgi:cyclomaltodextrinase / maltogenic alpha-amylase / neopullulanase